MTGAILLHMKISSKPQVGRSKVKDRKSYLYLEPSAFDYFHGNLVESKGLSKNNLPISHLIFRPS